MGLIIDTGCLTVATQADITYAEFDIKYNVEFGIVMDVEISICL